MNKIILISLFLVSACGYPITDSHDVIYSPTIVTNSNVPIPNQNWEWNKRNNEDRDNTPLYYRHRRYYSR